MELVYSLAPRRERVLIDRDAAEQSIRLAACETWTEFAELIGWEWEEVVERYDEWLEPEQPLERDTPFDVLTAVVDGPFTGVVGHAGDERRAAAGAFRNAVGELMNHPIVQAHLKVVGGAIGSDAELLEFDSEEGLREVEAFLRRNGRDLTFVRDEGLFDRF